VHFIVAQCPDGNAVKAQGRDRGGPCPHHAEGGHPGSSPEMIAVRAFTERIAELAATRGISLAALSHQ